MRITPSYRCARIRRSGVLVGAVGAGLALTLTACGSANTSSDGSMDHGSMSSSMSSPMPSSMSSMSGSSEHNDADVTFATEMIQHHQQALDMVDLTQGRSLEPAVQNLADNIRAAQAPEIKTMSGWLTDWGMPTSSTSPSMDPGMEPGMDPGMDMGHSGGMSGMMSEADMTKLRKASDADFQQMWLQMMIEHHQGAVQMARTEQSAGTYQPAITLADQIISSQSKEITTMKQLLGTS